VAIKIESSVFEEGKPIPRKYTCDGVNVSPPLQWSSLSEDIESIAIICEDPDGGLWIHWVIFNLPPDTVSLPERVMEREILENGAVQGINDFGNVGYRGPCPPGGIHRYYFRIYALDVKIELPALTTKKELLKSMEGHIIDQGQIMGVYSR
jgi:Raf kinase inhibitor-like YbhB/YbcL family protein